MTTLEILITILLIAGATLLTRALPFFVFPADKPLPGYVQYLGKVLPTAVIGMLVVYCFKSVTPLVYPYGLPELIALGFLIIVHRKWHQIFFSIGGSTLLYMVLVQSVFI